MTRSLQVDGVPDHAAPAVPVEPKVKAATAAGASSAAVLLPFVLWLLGVYVFPDGVPVPVQGLVGLVVTGAATFAAGWSARHVNRGPAAS